LREKGGAYGGGATLSSGIFSFYSYRDPRSLKTLEDFSRTAQWIATTNDIGEKVKKTKVIFVQSNGRFKRKLRKVN
jgi:Zn-dependent M16 (insulinase) family peptidase